MAMLIGKFHRLIQSRLVWSIILGMIVIAFIGFGTPFLFASKTEREAGMAGTLNGKGISRRELWDAIVHVRASVAFSTGRMPPMTEETETILRKAAWRRIASLREAERLGFATGPSEIQDAIRSQPVFQQNGRFSLEAYRAMLGRVLGESGLGESFFEEHIRQELLLQKVRMLAAQAVLAPPADVERIYSVLEDEFKIEFVEMKRGLVESGVTVSDADLKAFFDKDPSRYEIPPKVTVKYVHFARAAFTNGLPAPPAEDIEDYYDDHRAQFTVRVPAPAATNAAAGATNAAPEMVEKLRPLEEVRDPIVAALNLETAMNRAEQASADFINRIAPERREKPLPFEDAARAASLEVRPAGPFSRESAVAGVKAGPEFNRAAFALNSTPEEYFSNPVRGEEGYYVMALDAKLPARIPTLDEVRKSVAADAREAAIEAALDAKAAALIADVKGGKATLADAAKALGLTVVSPPPFTATGQAKDNPHAERMMPELATCNAGEFAPVIRTFDDTRLVVRVAERTPASRGKLADMRRSISDLILRERENAFVRAYEEDLLQRGGFVDKTAKKSRGDDDEG
jgi:peptidyl-prolyl cis-trans isomerase D